MPMKIDSMKVGEKYKINVHDEDNKPLTLEFTILEIDWYPSATGRGFFHGTKVQFTTGEIEILPFLVLDSAEKVKEEA